MKKITAFLGSLFLSASLSSAMEPIDPESMYNEFKYTYSNLSMNEFSNIYLDCEGSYSAIKSVLEHRSKQPKEQKKATVPTIRVVPITPELLFSLMAQTEEGCFPGIMPSASTSYHGPFHDMTPEILTPSFTNPSHSIFDTDIPEITDKEFFKVDTKPTMECHPIIQKHYDDYNSSLKKQFQSTNLTDSIEAKGIASDQKRYNAGVLHHMQEVLRELEDQLLLVTGKIYFHTPSFDIIGSKVVQTFNNSYQAQKPKITCHPLVIMKLEAERNIVFDYLTVIHKKF